MELPTKDQIEQFRTRIQNDPVFFIEKVLGNPLWEKQKEIVEAVRDHKEVAIRSCHASGKSYVSGRIVHWYLNAFKDSVVITTAPTFRQVKEVLWREIKGSCAGKKIYKEKNILDTAINIAPQHFALGLSTDKPDQFQGFHSPHLMVLIDEASGIDPLIEEAIDGLTPSKIVRIGQPLQTTGRFADSFRMPDIKKMRISAFDVPNVKTGEVVIPGLITAEDVEKFKLRYGEDSDVYRVRVLGEFPEQDADALISLDDVVKAQNREVKVPPHFEKKLGVDVARFGNDSSVLTVRQMEKVIRYERFYGQDTMQIAGQVLRLAKEEYIKPENIFVDVIGVGGGVVDRLKEQGWNVKGVNVAESPKDKENYVNLRAELYASSVKDWLKTGQLPKDDDWLELASIKYKFNSQGKLQLESKEDMKKRGLDSPDVADSLMLTFADKEIFIMPEASVPLEPVYTEIGF